MSSRGSILPIVRNISRNRASIASRRYISTLSYRMFPYDTKENTLGISAVLLGYYLRPLYRALVDSLLELNR